MLSTLRFVGPSSEDERVDNIELLLVEKKMVP